MSWVTSATTSRSMSCCSIRSSRRRWTRCGGRWISSPPLISVPTSNSPSWVPVEQETTSKTASPRFERRRWRRTSPKFSYRVDLVDGSGGIQPLSNIDLASRLSYFLWSSMPDEELLRHAASGDLRKPEVIKTQVRRMLQDPHIRALAVEFGGNWLGFRDFEQIGTVDKERFPSFSDELRNAMFEEPVRFLLDVFRRNR